MKKTSGFSIIPVLAIVMALVVLTMIGWVTVVQFTRPEPGANLNTAACTLEAKVCPDGTSVGRVPPSCEFAACPGTNTNTAANVNAVTNTNTGVVPADWKTYTNETYGFRLKYPPTWTSRSPAYGGASSTTGQSQHVLGLSPGSFNGDWAVLVTVNPGAIETTLSDPNYYWLKLWSISKREQKTVNTYAAEEVTWSNTATLLYVQKSDTSINVQFDGVVNSKRDEVADILSTFQFFDQTVATKDWKTYTNATYGYSIKYPDDYTPSGTAKFYTFQKGKLAGDPTHRITVYALTPANKSSAGENWYDWAIAGFPADNSTVARLSENKRQETYGGNTYTVVNYDAASGWNGAPLYYLIKGTTVYVISDWRAAGGGDDAVVRNMLTAFTATK